MTAEGHEATLALNHLAPFVLTHALEPALRAGGAGAGGQCRLHRVRPGQSRPGDDLECAHGWGPMRAYCRAKLALMMATFERAQRLDGTWVTVNVVHPGGGGDAVRRRRRADRAGCGAWRARSC